MLNILDELFTEQTKHFAILARQSVRSPF